MQKPLVLMLATWSFIRSLSQFDFLWREGFLEKKSDPDFFQNKIIWPASGVKKNIQAHILLI